MLFSPCKGKDIFTPSKIVPSGYHLSTYGIEPQIRTRGFFKYSIRQPLYVNCSWNLETTTVLSLRSGYVSCVKRIPQMEIHKPCFQVIKVLI